VPLIILMPPPCFIKLPSPCRKMPEVIDIAGFSGS
jgi:hypothetical protein